MSSRILKEVSFSPFEAVLLNRVNSIQITTDEPIEIHSLKKDSYTIVENVFVKEYIEVTDYELTEISENTYTLTLTSTQNGEYILTYNFEIVDEEVDEENLDDDDDEIVDSVDEDETITTRTIMVGGKDVYIDVRVTPSKFQIAQDITIPSSYSGTINGNNAELWTDYISTQFYFDTKRNYYPTLQTLLVTSFLQDDLDSFIESYAGGTIVISDNITLDDSFKLSSGIILDGNSKIISGSNDSTFLFYYCDGSTQVNSLTFRDVNITFESSKVYFSNCIFIDCNFSNLNNSDVVFSNCTFNYTNNLSIESETLNIQAIDSSFNITDILTINIGEFNLQNVEINSNEFNSNVYKFYADFVKNKSLSSEIIFEECEKINNSCFDSNLILDLSYVSGSQITINKSNFNKTTFKCLSETLIVSCLDVIDSVFYSLDFIGLGFLPDVVTNNYTKITTNGLKVVVDEDVTTFFDDVENNKIPLVGFTEEGEDVVKKVAYIDINRFQFFFREIYFTNTVFLNSLCGISEVHNDELIQDVSLFLSDTRVVFIQCLFFDAEELKSLYPSAYINCLSFNVDEKVDYEQNPMFSTLDIYTLDGNTGKYYVENGSIQITLNSKDKLNFVYFEDGSIFDGCCKYFYSEDYQQFIGTQYTFYTDEKLEEFDEDGNQLYTNTSDYTIRLLYSTQRTKGFFGFPLYSPGLDIFGNEINEYKPYVGVSQKALTGEEDVIDTDNTEYKVSVATITTNKQSYYYSSDEMNPGDLDYTWYFNSIPSQTYYGNTYNYTIRTADNLKTIYCEISDGIETIYTKNVTILIASAPIISYTDSSVVTFIGSNVALESSIANLVGEYSYQWGTVKNGIFTPIEDATELIYFLESVDKSDIASYKIITTIFPENFTTSRTFTNSAYYDSSETVSLNVCQTIIIDDDNTTHSIDGMSNYVGDTMYLKITLKEILDIEATYEWRRTYDPTLPIEDWEVVSSIYGYCYYSTTTMDLNYNNYYYCAYVYIKDEDTGIIVDFDTSLIFQIPVQEVEVQSNDISNNIVLCKIAISDLNKSIIDVGENYAVYTSAENADPYTETKDFPSLHIRSNETEDFEKFTFPSDINIDKSSEKYGKLGIASDHSNNEVYILDLENVNYDFDFNINKPLVVINIPNLITSEEYEFERLGFKVFIHNGYFAVSDPYCHKTASGSTQYVGRVFLFSFDEDYNVKLLKILKSPNEVENGSFGDNVIFDNYGNILVSATEEENDIKFNYIISDSLTGELQPTTASGDGSLDFTTKGRVYLYSLSKLEESSTIISENEYTQILTSQYIANTIDYTNKTWGAFSGKYTTYKKYTLKDRSTDGATILETYNSYAQYESVYDFYYAYDFSYKNLFPTIFSEMDFVNNDNDTFDLSLTFTYSTNMVDECFGATISTTGDSTTVGYLLVGAPHYNDNTGYVELWVWTGLEYVYINNLQNPNSGTTCFGMNVELSNDYFLVAYKNGTYRNVGLYTYSIYGINASTKSDIVFPTKTSSFGESMDSYQNTFLITSPEDGKIYRYSYTSDTSSSDEIQLIDLETQGSASLYGEKIVATNDKLLVSYRSYGPLYRDESGNTIQDENGYDVVNIGIGAILQYNMSGNEFRLL